MMSRSKDIIFLLGAGASSEAGIPVSAEMIDRVERHLKDIDEWKNYDLLYKHVKSAIHFSSGLKGRFGSDVPFNIETLVNTLYELEKNEEHPLYPFIAAWSSRFVELAGSNFCKVQQFRQLILKALKKWMCPEDSAKSNYYKGLIGLQRDLNYPLHIFSLNYDLCVEHLAREIRVETGFEDSGPDYSWDYERFSDLDLGNNPAPHIVLYKLHGSINWKRHSDTKTLYSVDQIESVDPDKMDVIFGRDFKLEAADPYLFFAYMFRNLTLETKLIVTVGYGFGDDHINKILTQGLRDDPERRLLVTQRPGRDDSGKKKNEILKRLELANESQVIFEHATAKQFLERPGLAQFLVSKIPQSEGAPF
jgi:hypothetical protein